MQMRTVDVDGQTLRVGIRPGSKASPPLLIFNGIGANLELVRPFAEALDDVEVIVFDIPGVGGSPAPVIPYRFFTLAALTSKLLSRLGHDGKIDVLGVSWGGALAQEFAHLYPQRCRRLILAATSPGAIMVPGKLSVLSKMIRPRRYTDPAYLEKVGPHLYGGAYRQHPELLHQHGQHMQPPRGRGYVYQLLAGAGWSSLPWLHRLRQPTLILHGSDDPIVPLVNARFMAARIPRATLHVIDDGHLFLVTRIAEIVPVILRFLRATFE